MTQLLLPAGRRPRADPACRNGVLSVCGALVASEIGYALAGPVWGGGNVCTELPNSPHHYTMSQKFELPEGHFLFTSYVSAHF